MRSWRLMVVSALLMAGVGADAQVTLVADGRAAAVIVLPVEPNDVERYAVEELAYHVQRGTGVTLAIVAEGTEPAQPAGRVFIGNTAAAQAAGIDVSTLARETVVLRTDGDRLFIAGEDTAGDPLVDDTRCGTLWGVYELLDRFLGVRWLWPGELGVHVPPTDTVTIGALDELLAPKLMQRRVRDGLRRPAGDTGLSAEGFERYARAQRVFQRRHRMGRSLPLRYGHAFESWWETYGAEHPEWFQLLPDGRRGPNTPTSRTSMCVSDENFRREVIARWKQARAENPGQWLNVNGCENDISGLCTCENCLAWDGPQPDFGALYDLRGQRMVSDRYARFWLSLQQMAAEEDPDAIVMGYAYTNYYPAPTSGIQLNRNILVGMCPWPGWWYPRSDEAQQWLKDQWAGWSETGASIFLRPNYTLDSYTMPHIYAHQFADEFQHYAAHGMVATDFDSLTGQWAAQGTNLYLLFRLHTRADQPVDEVLDEYYSAFGPAADAVRAYFDYWEAYVMEDRDRFDRAQREAGVSRYRNFAAFAHVVFPPEVFPPAQALLDRAAQAAVGDELAAARVQFLRNGLEHARLCASLAAINAGVADNISPVGARRLMDQIMALRRATEDDCVANFDRCAAVEEASWQILGVQGYTGEPLQAVADEVAPLADGAMFSLRHAATLVAMLGADEPFRARLEASAVGRADMPVTWQLYGPDDTRIASGKVATGETGEIEATSGQAGVHLLVVNAGQAQARVTLLNDHAALAGRRVAFIHATGPMFVHVPAGLERFTVTVSASAGETARALILDPEGTEVARVETVETPEVVAEVAVPAGMSGRAWQVVIERASAGILEDYALTLDPALPPYWAHGADRLVVPTQ